MVVDADAAARGGSWRCGEVVKGVGMLSASAQTGYMQD